MSCVHFVISFISVVMGEVFVNSQSIFFRQLSLLRVISTEPLTSCMVSSIPRIARTHVRAFYMRANTVLVMTLCHVIDDSLSRDSDVT
jgi:hypothetical protein